MATLIRVDRNGTKYYSDTRCPRCGGTGVLREYAFIEGGRCFLCGGSGYHETHWKEYTPEYAEKLAERRLARARKGCDEYNRKFLEINGFSSDGKAWLVLGNTFDIKDDLKADGAKYNNTLGWHYDREQDRYPTLEISIDDVAEKNYAWRYDWTRDAYLYIQQLREDNIPKTPSEYIGEVGDTLEREVTSVSVRWYETHFTYRGETHWVYTFRDSDENTIVWITTACKEEIEEGKTFKIKGAIKEHREYKGDKQTILKRCTVKEVAKNVKE